MGAFFAALGAVLLFLLKLVGILLLVVLVLALLLLLIPFCADIAWEKDVLTVKAGALGLTFPVFRYPKPEPPETAGEPKGFWAKWKARRAERKRKKAAQKPKQPPKEKKPAEPRKKAKLTLHILCTILRGAGALMKAVFGALRITHIRVCLGVRGSDPADAARSYGKLQAGLYPALGFLDRFLYFSSTNCASCRTSAASSPRWRTGCPCASRRRRCSSSSPRCGCWWSSGAKRCWTCSCECGTLYKISHALTALSVPAAGTGPAGE